MLLYALFILHPFTICIAHEVSDTLEINKSSNYYYINDSLTFCVNYELKNKSNNNYWLWFEEDVFGKSEKEIIKNHFFKIKGDWSLYQLAFEYNITGLFVPEIFSGFLKKINPQEIFNIQIIFTKMISENEKEQTFRYLDKHVIIISENVLEQYVKGLSSFNPLILYKNDFIILPEYLINF